jgi:hypothetical protein
MSLGTLTGAGESKDLGRRCSRPCTFSECVGWFKLGDCLQNG